MPLLQTTAAQCRPAHAARRRLCGLVLCALFGLASQAAVAATDYPAALRRAQYLLNATTPTDDDYSALAGSDANYKTAVRGFLQNANFYDAVLRYHEVLFGTGLDETYLSELVRDDIDNKVNKVAEITCGHGSDGRQRYSCYWTTQDSNTKVGSCPQSWEQAAAVFWYPGVDAWVCPDVMATCGTDLSQCLVHYYDQNAAQSAELGTTEIFDSQFAVTKSLSKQSAGLATAVVIANYPYKKILESGLTAIDGAIVHLMRLGAYFDMDKFHPQAALVDLVKNLPLTNTRFQLVNTGAATNQAGVLSTYGWLRRYEKNRTRANQTYQRLLCRQFTAQLPRVFPQDPGNLRTTPGCMGCHATLDPLADFFKSWGEGGDLYTGNGTQATLTSTFDSQTGADIADLASIIREDDAFATCTVTQVWTWLMGRGFYVDEAPLRQALTSYFVTVNYSFTELVYAITTHPAFIEGSRSDGVVSTPLDAPPLGTLPSDTSVQPCTKTINFATDIQPKLTMCTTCHFPGNTLGRQDLSNQAAWKVWGTQAVSYLSSGQMPPGQAAAPLIGPVYDLKEAARCWKVQNP